MPMPLSSPPAPRFLHEEKKRTKREGNETKTKRGGAPRKEPIIT